MRFRKSCGLTESEKILAALCEDSFLSLWSYPNLYRKPAKELCDLLVVFGDDVIVFSDKSCAFPNTGDVALDWDRWHRRSIAHSARQLRRAEDWLRKEPSRVFLDAKCTQPLPLQLPPADRLRVHRICVALGASERAFKETGRPNLTVSAIAEGGEEPFAIGKVTAARGFVHVFDETTLPTVLSELSTTADFLDYLRKKEALFNSNHFAFAESELDLLGYFLWNNREFPHDESQRFRLEPNLWDKVQADPHFLAGREENQVGRFWDHLIEYLTTLYMKRELEQGNDLSVGDYERALRIMTAETRFSRRLLAKWILERMDKAKGVYIGSCVRSMQADVAYVLLAGPGDGGKDHAEYRKARSEQLFLRCVAAKAVEPNARYIVGIALDARGVKGSSEDFVYMDTVGWGETDLKRAEQVRQEFGYFIKGKASETHIAESEYPGT